MDDSFILQTPPIKKRNRLVPVSAKKRLTPVPSLIETPIGKGKEEEDGEDCFWGLG